jgi:phosphonate transport system permease protein
MRDMFLADRAGLRARHAAVLAPDRKVRRMVGLGIAAALALYLGGLAMLDLSPARLWSGLGRLGDILALMAPPLPASWARVEIYLHALGETLAIAFLGTMAGAALAVPFGFLAARTVVANRIVHFLARRTLDAGRSIDTLIWALIWINVVGLGPFAGALAIMSADLFAFAKLMSEAIEAAERGPVEGVVAAGGSPLAALRFGVVPQVLPVVASQVLYYFESNTRSATIIGIVGAGGIGLVLSEQIRVLEWREAAFIILLVLAAVGVIDAVSSRLRAALIGARPG